MVWINVKKELHRALARAGITREINATQVLALAQESLSEIFDRETVGSVEFLYVRSGTLVIRVPSPVIAQEIRLHQREFIAALNKRLSREEVQRISFRY